MNNNELDVWESLLIRNIKGRRFSIRMLRRIWAKRCGIELEYVNDWQVLRALAGIVDKLDVVSFDKFISTCDEQNRWFFMTDRQSPRPVEILVSSFCFILKFTPYKKLIGYRAPSYFARKHKEISHD